MASMLQQDKSMPIQFCIEKTEKTAEKTDFQQSVIVCFTKIEYMHYV